MGKLRSLVPKMQSSACAGPTVSPLYSMEHRGSNRQAPCGGPRQPPPFRWNLI